MAKLVFSVSASDHEEVVEIKDDELEGLGTTDRLKHINATFEDWLWSGNIKADWKYVEED